MTKHERNREIIRLFQDRITLKDIAVKMGISESIVKHVIYSGKNIDYQKGQKPKRNIPQSFIDRVKVLGQFGDYSFEEISHETGLKVSEVEMILS